MPNKYSDPTLQGESFALLPVPSFNKIMWRSGDSRLAPLLQTDPGQYLGEFRSMIDLPASDSREAITFPVLPWTVVKRKAGRDTYSRYSTTQMYFRPISARLRYVLYLRDDKGQKIREKNRDVVVSVVKTFVKGSGYSPQKEVFGMVFDKDGKFHTYGLLSLDGWSSFISYDRAARAFDKIAAPEGKLIVYHLGTRGTQDAEGEIIPKVKIFNGGESVDIEPLDLDAPMFMTIDDGFDAMWSESQTWANCPRWNAEKVHVNRTAEVTHEEAVPPEGELIYVDEPAPY